MSNLLEEMDKYFKETPKEKVLEDWAKSEKYDSVGITVNEFMKGLPKINMEKESSVQRGVFRKYPTVIVYNASWGSCGILIGKNEDVSSLKNFDIVEFEKQNGYAINVKFIEHEKVAESDLEKLQSIAEEMVKDLIEASEGLKNPYESIAKYYNFKQSLKEK